MEPPPERPKVRHDLSVQPIEEGGRRFLLVEDPFGILPEPITLTEVGGLILSLLDGQRTIPEVKSAFASILRMEDADGFLEEQIRLISKIGLLENADYHIRRAAVLEEFTSFPTRPARHAGTGYEGDAERLGEWIDEVLGPPPPPTEEATHPRILVAPHIDFRVNTKVYADAYRHLAGKTYDRVILMGTGHSILEGVYSPSAKRFVTPLGETASDRGAVEQLRRIDHGVVAPHDFPHQSEHALEFQLIFLQHLLGPDNFELVPILCGSLTDWLHRVDRLGEVEEVRPFLEALRGVLEERGRRTLVAAGVDFSHIGRRFSHNRPAGELLEETRRHDRRLIDAFGAWDAEEFWGAEEETDGFYNVCGFSTLATLLEAMDPVENSCVGYDVWNDEPTESAVTFAAIVG